MMISLVSGFVPLRVPSRPVKGSLRDLRFVSCGRVIGASYRLLREPRTNPTSVTDMIHYL